MTSPNPSTDTPKVCPRTGPALPTDLMPGRWVTVYGPNLDSLRIPDFTEDGDHPTLDTPNVRLHLTPGPALAHLSGLPLRIAAATHPFVALELFDVDRTPLNVMIIDTRRNVLCPLDDLYVDQVFKACLAARSNKVLKTTRQLPDDRVTDFASVLLDVGSGSTSITIEEEDGDDFPSQDHAPSPLEEE